MPAVAVAVVAPAFSSVVMPVDDAQAPDASPPSSWNGLKESSSISCPGVADAGAGAVDGTSRSTRPPLVSAATLTPPSLSLAAEEDDETGGDE